MGWKKPVRGSLGTAFIIEKVPSNKDSCRKCKHYDTGSCMKNNVVISEIKSDFYKYCKSFSKVKAVEVKQKIKKSKTKKKSKKIVPKKIEYVRLYDYTYNEEVKYYLVDTDSVDASKNRISENSLLFKSLEGKKNGDMFDVITLDGVESYRIIEIKRN